MNPDVNYGFWMIMMCQRRSIDCNKCTTLVGDIDNAEGCAWGEQGAYEKSLYLPRNFAVNLKLL